MRAAWSLSICALVAGCLAVPSRSQDGGPPIDGDGGDGTAEACGTLSALQEPFDGDPDLGLRWSTSGGLNQIGETIELMPGPSSIRSAERFLPRGELVVGPVSMEGSGTAQIFLRDADFKAIRFGIEGTSLVAGTTDGRNVIDAYDALDDVYWRIRLDGDEAEYATSFDGLTYSPHGVLPRYLDAPVDLTLAVGGTGTAMTIGGVNPYAEAQARCPASTLIEPFDAPNLDWQAAGGTCATEIDGVLRLVQAAGGDTECIHRALRSFDLTDDQIEIEVAALGLTGGTIASVRLTSPGGLAIEVTRGGTVVRPTLVGRVLSSISETSDDLVWAASSAWLRIRADESAIYLEASADRVAWDQIHVGVAPVADLGEIQVSLVALSDVGLAGEVRFAGLNTP